MGLPGRKFTFRPQGVSDTLDGTNSFPGAMQSLQNLIPAPQMKNAFTPRPASQKVVDFTVGGGFVSPAGITVYLPLGTRVYGLISSGDFPGKDRPFCWDFVANAFIPISGMTSALLPSTQPTSGDWTPPTVDFVGSRIVFTHPGFPGGAGAYFGWLDISGFVSNTITGNTHGTTTVDTLSTNPIQAGWEVGMTISSSAGDIPAGTYIVSMTATSVTLSQGATASNTGVTLTVKGGTPSAPLWGAGNTNGGTQLASVPTAVANFNGRAYYATGNNVVFSDTLNPCQVTSSPNPQVLTVGDNTAVTALAGLPLSNQVTGGILQSMIVFKGVGTVFQITGDAALSNLALNAINGSVGTVAPNSITPTPEGLVYVANDGLRMIDLYARCSDPIGANGDGVNVPFLTAINPTRIAACFNQNALRISVQNGAISGEPYQEYWLDMHQKIWTGPHTFPASLIQPYESEGASEAGYGFLAAPVGVNAALFASGAFPTLASGYQENGVALSFNYVTSLFPDNDDMSMNSIIESTLAMNLTGGQSITVIPTDDSGNQLDSVVISQSGLSATLWGAFVWGAAAWGSSGPGYYRQYQIPWDQPLVFKQASLSISGFSYAGFVIGNFYSRIEQLEYLIVQQPITTGFVQPMAGIVVNTSTLISSNIGTYVVIATSATTQTLPAIPVLWETHTIKDGGGNALNFPITISGNGNQIDGQSQYIINANFGSITIQWDGSQWTII